MKCVVYYDKKNDTILEYFPSDLTDAKKSSIRDLWSQDIPRKILKLLTQNNEITAPVVRDNIGHSMSTLHENIKKLEDAGLISTEMIYEGNKQKIISTNVLCVSKNAKLTESITRFLNQGLWIDTQRNKKVVDFLDGHPNQWFTVEEISAKTGIQVDEVKTLLNNWDSMITRSFSDFLRQAPFEKRVLYKAKSK